MFAADGLPKQKRQNLPSIATIEQYLAVVRKYVAKYLQTAPIRQQERLWRWLIQHEGQHCETISFLWQLHRHSSLNVANFGRSQTSKKNIVESNPDTEMVRVAAGEFTIGSNEVDALDNERPAHINYT